MENQLRARLWICFLLKILYYILHPARWMFFLGNPNALDEKEIHLSTLSPTKGLGWVYQERMTSNIYIWKCNKATTSDVWCHSLPLNSYPVSSRFKGRSPLARVAIVLLRAKLPRYWLKEKWSNSIGVIWRNDRALKKKLKYIPFFLQARTAFLWRNLFSKQKWLNKRKLRSQRAQVETG